MRETFTSGSVGRALGNQCLYPAHCSEVVQRLLAQTCELCGAQEQCEVHHIRRLADLHKPGRKEKPLWVQRMVAYRRKTLVTCRTCHEALHQERPGRRHVPL